MAELSLVMPTKNRAHLIGETIQTIFQQTFKDWELVIVDDNSTDKTLKVVKKFQDQRISYYKLPSRLGGGPAIARNFGNLLAKTEIIVVVDSDDLNYPERLDITYDFFQKNPETDLFYAHADVWEIEKNLRRERRLPFTPFSIEEFKKVDFIPHPTVAYRKKTILEFPYNPIFLFAEDYDMISRMAIAGKKIGYVNKKVVTQRFHPGRLSEDRTTQEKFAKLVRVTRDWEKGDINLDFLLEEIKK